MLPHSLLGLLTVITSSLAAPTAPSSQIPLIIWHGLGDNYAADGLASVAKLAEKINPGTFVYPIRLAEDAGSDRTATWYGNLTEQMQYVCDDLASHKILSKAPAVNALGFSQGGQFLRGYIERCNNPPVRNLVTFGSQHSGISSFQRCKTSDWLCQSAAALLRNNAFGSFAQGRLVPAQYYRSLNFTTGRPTEEYLENSNYLADVNNEREEKNATYKENIAALDNFVSFMFGNDTTVVPRESAWFADVLVEDPSTGVNRTVIPLNETRLYKEDWLGLKELEEKGALKFKTHPGGHMELDDEILVKVFKEYFGPTKEERLKVHDLFEQLFEL
ncbi:hypothetical protein LTS18_015149 [Coniosporium uncinatum]|uniref:Uncharacterized protein n=1 Tax=Coniosporium uncinatum TaxID=93489 RepID=A0ACC3DV73_9PEZI|nr:hypothetical protein LTS18_015149 [Coniosporium uncinatum]